MCGEGFSGRRPQGWVVAAELLLLLDRAQEAQGDVALCGRLDQRVSILGALVETLFEFMDPPLEAVENLLSFFADVGQLSIGEVRHICHVNLAVVPQGEEGRPG